MGAAGLIRCAQAGCVKTFGRLAVVPSLDDVRYQAEAHGWTSYPAEGGRRLDYCPGHS